LHKQRRRGNVKKARTLLAQRRRAPAHAPTPAEVARQRRTGPSSAPRRAQPKPEEEREAHAAPGELQLQTCFSDGWLVLCAWWACGLLGLTTSALQLARAGFFVVGVAATFGVIRFTGYLPFVAIPIHDSLSLVAGLGGLPAVALAAWLPADWDWPGLHDWLVVASLLALSLSALRPKVRHSLDVPANKLLTRHQVAGPLGSVLSMLSGASLVLKGLLSGGHSVGCAFFLVTGVAIAVLAGEFVKPSRKNYIMWGNLWLGVDAFHFLLGPALVSIAYGVSWLHPAI
jgi:hypothetical protein